MMPVKYSKDTSGRHMKNDRFYSGAEEYDHIPELGNFAITDTGSRPTSHHNTPQPSRFIAGDNFFNYEMYGSLRENDCGTEMVDLLSSAFRGYAISGAVSGYITTGLEFLLLRLVANEYNLEYADLTWVSSLSWSLILLVGLFSDRWAPFGYRRNSYILLGWLMAAFFFLAVFVCGFLLKDDEMLGIVSTLLVGGATLSIVVATSATQIRLVEISQSEPLLSRGSLIGTYMIIFCFAKVIMQGLILLIASSDKPKELILPFTTKWLILHFALLCFVPVLSMVNNACERKISYINNSIAELGTKKQKFRQVVQQKAVWHLILSLCVVCFFIELDYREPRSAVAKWSNETPTWGLWRYFLGDLALVFVLVYWRARCINSSWPRIIAFVAISWGIVNTLIACLAIFPVFDDSFGGTTTLLYMDRAGIRALILLFPLIPAVEVAQVGSEGTMVGILATFPALMETFGDDLMQWVLKTWPSLTYEKSDITAHGSQIQMKVLIGLLGITLINMISLLGLPFLPKQKLDSQQLRVYGGYSRSAFSVFVFFYCLSLAFVFYSEAFPL